MMGLSAEAGAPVEYGARILLPSMHQDVARKLGELFEE
jgi:hypothetical protein